MGAETGIRCPRCGCPHAPVLRTIRIPNGVRRRHQCRNCGARFNSRATVEPVKK